MQYFTEDGQHCVFKILVELLLTFLRAFLTFTRKTGNKCNSKGSDLFLTEFPVSLMQISSWRKEDDIAAVGRKFVVSDCQTLIKSCSIESRNDPGPKSEVVHEVKFSLNISLSNTLARLDKHQTSEPVMTSVVISAP